MYHCITAGFLIWKMLSDLRIIFAVCMAIRNISNVIVASTTDAMCPWGCHKKIELLDFSVKVLLILSITDICGALPYLICIYLFGVLRRFQHWTGHITTGSWKGRQNQYIQFVRVLYCKLTTNGKQLPAFPLEAVSGIEPRPQRWEARVLPLCHRGPRISSVTHP